MNGKKSKEMRRAARSFIAQYKMDEGTFRKVYKSIKKGVRNEAKLARFNITTNQSLKRSHTIHKEPHSDTND